MTIPKKILTLVFLLSIAGCSPDQLTAPLNGATNLFGDPATRECRAKERQRAFDQGLNPAQAMQRMQARCG